MFQEVKLLVVVTTMLFSNVVFSADIQQCQRAYSEGKVSQAYDSCLPLAQVGDPQAAFILARLYALGLEGGLANWEKVIEWLTISAAGDHAEAAYNLAIAYQLGKGTPIDLSNSLKYYRQSVALGNPKAMRNLALLYEKGEAVEQDVSQAFSLYQQSAEAGLSDSQLKTGLMLAQGEGVAKDPVAGRGWIEKSAESGNDKAQLALGVMLMDVDPAGAVKWYSRAVAQGNAYAAHNLALLYSEGHVIPSDLLQALAYADRSIELGNHRTQPLYDTILSRIQKTGLSQAWRVNDVVPVNLPDTARVKPQTHVDEALHDLNWLKQQPPGLFTVQLARLTSEKGALRFIHEYQLEGQAYAVSLAVDDYVVLLKDSFANKTLALSTYKTKLPSPLSHEAWIRSYRSLYAK